jgi:hypothetical protein
MAKTKPIQKDFEFPRGDTQPFSFDITDYGGNELDLTNAEIYFTFKLNESTQEYILQKKKSTGGILVDGTLATFILEHDDTAELDYGKYFYDIQVKSGSYVKTLALGYIKLTKEATWKANE